MSDEPTVPKVIDRHDLARACRYIEAYRTGRFDGQEHPEHLVAARAVAAALNHEVATDPPGAVHAKLKGMTVMGLSMEKIKALARFFTDQTGRPPEQVLEHVAATRRE